MAVSEARLKQIKRGLFVEAEKAIPGSSEEDKKRRNAYVYSTLREIKEGKKK